jgi:hypothetical protein
VYHRWWICAAWRANLPENKNASVLVFSGGQQCFGNILHNAAGSHLLRFCRGTLVAIPVLGPAPLEVSIGVTHVSSSTLLASFVKRSYLFGAFSGQYPEYSNLMFLAAPLVQKGTPTILLPGDKATLAGALVDDATLLADLRYEVEIETSVGTKEVVVGIVLDRGVTTITGATTVSIPSVNDVLLNFGIVYRANAGKWASVYLESLKFAVNEPILYPRGVVLGLRSLTTCIKVSSSRLLILRSLSSIFVRSLHRVHAFSRCLYLQLTHYLHSFFLLSSSKACWSPFSCWNAQTRRLSTWLRRSDCACHRTYQWQLNTSSA